MKNLFIKLKKSNRILVYFLLLFFIFFYISNINAQQFNQIQILDKEVQQGSIVLGDIDNDGHLDLIISGYDGSSNYLRSYKNNGSGSFTFFENISPGIRYGSIALGDINSDGYLDLIITGGSGNFKTYKNNGSGSFTFFEDIVPDVSLSSIAMGDIDSDGDLDMVMMGSEGGNYHLKSYTNKGNGSFALSKDLSSSGKGFECSITLGDIDSDGDLDLIMTGWEGGNRYFQSYTNNGDGDLTLFEDISSPGVGMSSIAMGDIDADGDLDLIITGDDNFSPFYYLKSYTNNGNGCFSLFQDLAPPGIFYGSIALGDINSDGYLDLIITGSDNGTTNHFESYWNNGDGTFTFFENIASGVWLSSIALGDIDSDGDLDLIMTGQDGGYNSKVYRNTIAASNNPPSTPSGMSCEDVGGYWRFKWSASSDAITHPNMLRYKIAIGINSSGVYDYSSANIDYPRGQANIGNVPLNIACYYQSKIPVGTTTYWKVCCIDSAFMNSAYCGEQIAPLPQGGGGGTNGTDISQKTDYSKDKIKLFPNYIGPGDADEVYIYLGGLDNPEPEYKIIISSIAGNVVRDLGTISYKKLNEGIRYALLNENNKSISTGLYIVLIVGSNDRFVKKLYVKR